MSWSLSNLWSDALLPFATEEKKNPWDDLLND